ncbi:MAG TPA: Cof-type HAD-IIB family hydrolase [Actinomycetota bacterium]|jgi:HAD superfamily hydrolase (TIGR01484 family)|nr:Cof-type HAD-IIB family hydrolase [Actinomycetota bacterium]
MDGVRLVASDLDGTLLRPGQTVSDRTRAALAAAREAGITVVLVTGRQPRSLAPVAERIGVGGIAICANGALIWDLDTGTMVDSTPLAAEVATRLVHAVREAVPGVLLAVELEERFGREPGWAEDSSPIDPGALEADALELITGPVIKLLARHPTLPFAEFSERARRAVGDDAVATWADLRLVEISAAGVTKAYALERLCQGLGIDPSQVVAVGDMPNDLAMLRWAGTAVAVANATQEVLDAADEVTASNLEDGVAQLLERILRMNGSESASGRRSTDSDRQSRSASGPRPPAPGTSPGR